MTPSEVLHECYLKYKEYTKKRYGWTQDEGIFQDIVEFVIKDDIVTKLSKTVEVVSDKRKTSRKSSN